MKNEQLKIAIINGIVDIARTSNMNELIDALTEINMLDIDFTAYGSEYRFYDKNNCQTTTINAIFKEVKKWQEDSQTC